VVPGGEQLQKATVLRVGDSSKFGSLMLLLSSAVAWSAGLYLLCTARAQAAVNQVRQEMSQLIGDSRPGDDVPLG
jgi:hypothetical protein